MRELRVMMAMLVGACIGISAVVVFYGHRFGWPASRPFVVVPLCGVIAIFAILKWRSLDADITADIERKIEALSRCYRFEASLRKSQVFTVAAGGFWLTAMAALARREPMLERLIVLAVGLLLIACLIMVAGHAWQPGPTLVMDKRGLQHAALGRIPWASIVGLQYREIVIGAGDRRFTVRTLSMAIASPHLFARRFPWLALFLRPSLASRATAFGEVLISLDTLDEPAEVIVAAAYEFRGRDEAPFVDAWEAGMPSREIAARLAEQTVEPT